MKKKISIVVIIILSLFVIGFLIFFLKEEIIPEETNLKIPLIQKQEKEKFLYAVMIDNYSFGRIHHRGISEAKILYEALAEGGITRIMAIFDKAVEEVGPVRSARPYFVQWAKEYQSVYVHVGGSDEAQNMLALEKDVFNVDGMAYEDLGDYFVRDKTIEKPHNDFANLQAIKTLIPKDREESQNILKFSKKKTQSSEKADIITMDFSFPNYKVRYDYDKILNKYFRYIGGKPHKDTSNDIQLSADNIIIQFMQNYPVDEQGRLKFLTKKGGNAYLIREGFLIRGAWTKENGKTKFTDENGKEFTLKKGVTWIEIIDFKNRVKIESL